ncbi:nramp transporter [Corchorus capsularis]|uniref:Nramp transporter n=1 Tax=Corchorus capsularis TaxID=210143 RepID=A0A1R3GJF7_COCAP|nr:nramp transporter [Corchorus capsularis]
MEDLKPNNSEGLTQSKSELPQEFINVMEDMGGFDAKFVIQKRLSVADTNLPPCYDDEDGLKRGFALVKVEDGQPRPPKKKPDRELKLKDDNHQKPKSKKEPKKIWPRK